MAIKTAPIELLAAIVEMTCRLLMQKLANGGGRARNEAALPHEFGHTLRMIEELHEFSLAHRFQLEFESYIDLTMPSIKVALPERALT